MVLSVGSKIDEFTITEVLYNRDHLDIFEVVDKDLDKHVLKMYKLDKSLPDVQEGSIKCFTWGGYGCVVQGECEPGKRDYFKLGCGPRVGLARGQSGGMVRTPMPREPETDEEEEDDDDDDDDDDEDEYDEEEAYVVTCQDTDSSEKLKPILLHDSDATQGSVNHVNIQSPVQKATHARHRDCPRTPTPGLVRTDENGAAQRSADNGRCHFQLKMISSSMLKRRGAKSMAM